MAKFNVRQCGFGLALALLSGSAWPADSLREQAWAHDSEGRVAAGELIWMEARGTRFPALFRDAVGQKTHGGVVMLHDMGGSPDTPEVLQPLRERLPEHGWATLSVLAPQWEAGASPDEYQPLLGETMARLDAGLAYLRERGIENIALLGYRHGGAAVLHFLSESTEPKARAVVLVAVVPNEGRRADAELLEALSKLRLPVLDLVAGSHSESAQARRRAAKANAEYRLIEVANARPGLEDVTDMLVNRIHGWLLRRPTSN